jgi:S1/P1 Nuclease
MHIDIEPAVKEAEFKPPAQWAWECHVVCVERVYKFTDGTILPKHTAKQVELTQENYIKANNGVVPEQLKKGGVRLAKVLNECFAEAGQNKGDDKP